MESDHRTSDPNWFSFCFPYRSEATLLLASLVGALVGALSAKFAAIIVSGSQRFIIMRTNDTYLRQLLLAAFFPTMLLLADLTKRKAAFFFVFFCRGAMISCLLCFSVCFVRTDEIPVLIETLLFRCLLPIPVSFFCAGSLMQDFSVSQGRRTILLLLPAAAELTACTASILLRY